MAVIKMQKRAAARKSMELNAAMPLAQQAAGGQVPLQSRWMDQRLWDTEPFATTGAQTLRLFTDLAAKSDVDSNIAVEGAMAGQSTYALHAIQVSILNAVGASQESPATTAPTLADMQNIRRCVRLEYLQGSKPIWRSPVEKLPAPGFHTVQASLNGADISAINLGNPVPLDYHNLGFIIAIAAGDEFSVNIVTDANFSIASALRVRVWLNGILTNPVR